MKSGADHVQINFPARVIDGLLLMNKPTWREDKSKDKTYIKALLMAVCRLENLQKLAENESPPKHLINFIKGK